jgi:hypothetical protein
MHPEIAIAIARQQCAERLAVARLGARRGAGRTRPVKAVRRALGR